MKIRTALLVPALTLGLLLPATRRAAAQEHEDRTMGSAMPGAALTGGCPGMMHAPPGAPGPAMLIRQRERLGLTDAEVQRLEQIAAATRQAMRRYMADLMRAHADLLEATGGDIQLEAARAALDRMARLHTEIAMAQLRAARDARQVLSPEQRARLEALGEPMEHSPARPPGMRPPHRHP